MRRKFFPYRSARIKGGLRRGNERQLPITSYHQAYSQKPTLPFLTTNGFLRHAQFCLFHLLGARDRVSAHSSHRLRWQRGQWYWLHHRVNNSSAAFLTDIRKFIPRSPVRVIYQIKFLKLHRRSLYSITLQGSSFSFSLVPPPPLDERRTNGQHNTLLCYSAIQFVCNPPVFVLPAIVFFLDGPAMATLFCSGSWYHVAGAFIHARNNR